MRDLPKGMTFVESSELRAAGLTPQQLPAYAAQKLLDSLRTVLRVDVHPGVYMLTCGGNYETGLLLLPEVWAEVDPLLAGSRVVAIPNRDLLFVTGCENADGIAWIREHTADAAERSPPTPSAGMAMAMKCSTRPSAVGSSAFSTDAATSRISPNAPLDGRVTQSIAA